MITWKPQLRFFATERGAAGGGVDKRTLREEGRRASWNEAPESDNPYPANSAEHRQWAEGYLEGLCERI